MFWFVIQDAIIYLSKTFRILSTFVVAVGVPFLCFEAYMYGGEVKSLIYSQILIIASTAVKRVLTDSERRCKAH
jgi:predicted permease